MATELFSIWTPRQYGWRSQLHDELGGYQMSAELDGMGIYYIGPTTESLDRLFSRAARRTFFRRWMPWLEAPHAHIDLRR